ncbi:MAG: multiheme c-type cytochrome [Verrucomicrobia bacterium]|nr:multiheme c-type cytochrome [Verrucomicrobiota bacterium]
MAVMVRFTWNFSTAVVAGLVAAWAAAGVACAAEQNPAAVRDPTRYIGLTICNTCHNATKVGNQAGKWRSGPHSRAFELLGSPEARAVAAKLGIANPQASGQCLKCHSTAYNWTEQIQTTAIKAEEGVVCESCHGPAQNYVPRTTEELTLVEPLHKSGLAELLNPFSRSAKTCYSIITMEDREKAIRGGLVYPAFQSCVRCHNEQSPTWKPDRYVNKQGKTVGFDLRQNFIKIAHPKPVPQ